MFLSNSLYDVRIHEDLTYTLFSVDNKPYELVIEMDEFTRNSHYKTLSIQITNLNSNNTTSIAVVGGIYSFSTENCAVLDGTKLIVFIQDSVAAIDLQTMALLTKRKVVDFGTAFAIYPFCGNYIIHGELEVVLINTNIEKEWSFSGRDIFVLPDEKSYLDVFKIQGERAVFYDWDGNQYTLDITGKEIK